MTALIIDAVAADNLVDTVTNNLKNSKIVIAKNMDISHFVDTVIAAVGNEKIADLRIWGHGNIDRPDGNLIFSTDVLDASSIDKFAPQLIRLAPRFIAAARAELRACAAAKGTGKRMMKRLAEIWNVNVDASTRSQSFVLFWEGEVFRATPVPGRPVQPTAPYNTN
jgi:hypothetical protein